MVLAIVMVISMVPVNAFASETEPEQTSEPTVETTEATTVETSEVTTEATTVETSEETTEATTVETSEETTEATTVETSEETTEATTVETSEETTEATEDAAVVRVQAMMDALATTVASEAEAEALEAAILAVDDAMAELVTGQLEQLDYTNYLAAMDALDAWYEEDHSVEELANVQGDAWYWDGNTLYILNGAAIDLYDALVEKYDKAPGKSFFRYDTTNWTTTTTNFLGTTYSNWQYKNCSKAENGGSIDLNHGTTYYAAACSSSSWGKESYDTSNIITINVKHYYKVGTAVASGSPDGAGISVDPVYVVKGNSTTVKVNAVDNYIFEVKNGNTVVGNTAEFTYEPSENCTLTVSYTEASSTGSVTVGSHSNGTVKIGTETRTAGAYDLAAGDYTITVTPDAGYYVSSFKVNGTGVTAYNADRSMSGSLTVAAKGSYTVDVVFTQQKIVEGDLKVLWNPVKSADGDTTLVIDRDTKTLDQRIIEAVIADGSIPATAVWSSATVKYLSYDALIESNDTWNSTSYTPGNYDLNHAFGNDFVSDETTEKVKIVFAGNSTYDGMEVTKTITLVEARKAYTLTKPEMSVTFETQTDIDNAVLTALQNANAGQTITATIADGQTLPTGGNTADLTYNVTVAANADHLGCTDTVTIAATAKSNPANITFATEGTGSGSVNFGGLTANGTLAAGTYTLTVTPADLTGSDGSAMYVDKVEVNGTAVTGTYSGGVFTASVTVANDTDVTVTITYGTRTLDYIENSTAKINFASWESTTDGLKNLFLNTALNTYSGSVTDYYVYLKVDLTLNIGGFEIGSYDYHNLDDDIWGSQLSALALKDGDTEDIKIEWRNTVNGVVDEKYVPVSYSPLYVKTVESRVAPTITVSSAVSGTFDTEAMFKDAVTNTINVQYQDENGAWQNIDKSDCGLDVVLTYVSTNDDGSTVYSVKAKATEAGDNWLASEDYTELGQFTWKISTYTVTFKHWSGDTLSSESYAYGTKAADIVVPEVAATYNYDEDMNLVSTTEFDRWDTEVADVTGDVTYTATYKVVPATYTVKFYDYDGKQIGDTQTVEYGKAATAPEATQTYQTETDIYTFKGWDVAFNNVVSDIEVKAQYDSVTRYYTYKYVDEDGTTVLYTNDKLVYADLSKTAAELYGGTNSTEALAEEKYTAEYTHTFKEWTQVSSENDVTIFKAVYTETANEYTLKWMNGETAYKTETVAYGETITVPDTDPTKKGYTFAGWDGYTAEMTMPAKDTEFTAKWTANTYTVKVSEVDSVNGYTIAENQSYTATYGEDYYLTFTLVEGAMDVFVEAGDHHYFTEDNCTLTKEGKTCTLKVDGNALSEFDTAGEFEIWITARSGLYFDLNGGTVGEGAYGTMLDNGLFACGYEDGSWGDAYKGEAIDVSAINSDLLRTVTRTGYNYAGLKQGDTVLSDTDTVYMDGSTLTVLWAADTDVAYKVNHYQQNLYGSYTLEAAVNHTGTTGSEIVFANVDREYTGFTAKAWTETYTIAADGSTVVDIYYDRNKHTVTWDMDGMEWPLSYQYGATVNAPFNYSKTGYTFQYWADADGNEVEMGFEMPDNDLTLTAYLTINQYTITFDTDGGTEIAAITQDYNTAVTAPDAPTKDGYRFDGWDKEIPSTMPPYDVTITAKWVKTYTYAYSTDHGTAPAGATVDVNTVITIADLLEQDNLTDGVKMTGWYINGELVSGEYTVDGDVTITAKWEADVDNDNIVDGTEGDPYWTVTVDGETVSTTTLNGEYADPAAPADKANMFFVQWNKVVDETAHTITFTSVWNENDTNDNNVDDALETATIKVFHLENIDTNEPGTGTVVVQRIINGTVTAEFTVTGEYTVDRKPNPNSGAGVWYNGYYTMDVLFDSVKGEQLKVIATPDRSQAANGYASRVSNIWKNTYTNISVSEGNYVMSATVTPEDGDIIGVHFYREELTANNGKFTMNGYYEQNLNMDEIIKTLKADVLNGAGLDGTKASRYTVTMTYSLGTLDLDKLVVTGFGDLSNALNASAFFAAIELPESGRQFTITDNSTGISKTVTMKIEDSRPSAGLVDTEVTDVKVLNDEQGLTDYVTGLANGTAVNPNGLTVSVALTEGSWPPAAAGVTTKLVYTVTYADSAEYIGDTATLTVYVQSAYNNCTVTAGSIGGGTMTVSPSNDNKTVAGNDTVSVTITPASGYAVETVTVYNQTIGEYVETSAITYSDKAATVTFKSDGSQYADRYVVSATCSEIKLTLNADQTIVYCVDDKNHTYDLQAMVFDAIYGGFNIDLTKDDVTLEFKYGTIIVDLWADVSGDPAINLNGISHKFGESGLETIRFTYEDEKYGKIQQTIDLNVFDSCYNNTVAVQTIAPEGTKHDFSVKYSEDAREYLGVKYYKQGTTLTVRLTPTGDDILSMLEQMYNKTYADNYPYIKSVTVYKNVDNAWVEVESTLERVNGELLQGENPLAYCAAVTFTMEHDTQYKIVAEYDILKLNRVSENKFQMEMYQAGKGYEAKVPSAQDFINKILGEKAAAEFLNTYGGSYKVEFSSDLITYNWTEVTDEALLALNDGTEIVVRITWTPADNNKTYYPMSVTAEPTLVDLRTATSVEGSVPTEPVEYVEEDQLIANLKEAMGLAIITANGAIDVEYDVNYTITVSEVNGNYATVIVTYHGSTEYKPSTRTFENVPVADIPDNATIKVTIQNASDRVTNNAGTIMSLDPSTGIYTVIGNGTYHFQFTPVSGKAIEAVTVNGVPVELTYSKGVATFSMYLNEKVDYEVVVETVDSVWVLEDERLYDFATGIDTPDNGKIADAATKAPTEIDFDQVELEYLARAEGTVTISLPSFTILGQNVELGTFDVELGELWLNPEEATELVSEDQLDKILEKLLEDLQDEILSGNVALTDALDYVINYVKTLPLGIHAFGVNGDGSVETVRFSYADDKYTLAQVVTDVTIHDYRTDTELAASDCEVTYGYSLSDLIAASGAQVLAEGAAVNVTIETNDLYKTVGTHEITLFFAGDKTYQPCEITVNVTVNKATVAIDYDSQVITYGDDYEFGISIAPSYHNDGTAVDPDMVEFMIGLDMHTLLDVDIEDKTVGIDQAVGTIYIRLPKSVREILTSDLAQALGITALLESEMTLSDLSSLVNTASDLLGIDEESLGILNEVITAITGITDSVDVKVKIVNDDFHPTNIGVYIAGAVTIEENYETAYTADYLIIAPKTYEAELAWNYSDSNGIMTLPVYEQMKDYMGAHVVETETMTGDLLDTANGHIKYLILGISDETSEFLTTDVYGNIKANIWTSNDAITDNGAYVQIAYMLNWGNEIYYAMPIVRSFLITPEVVNVDLVGYDGQENHELLKTFNGQAHGFGVKIYSFGELIYSDHYQDAVNNLPENAQLTVNYIGVQTNGTVYNSTEKPVHAGAYTCIATYLYFDENGDLQGVGGDAGLLVIEPSESTITVEDVVIKDFVFEGYEVNDVMNIVADSVSASDEYVTDPDYTVITGSIASTGDFSANGWEAITGTVNVDFPAWMDEVLEPYGVTDGITVSDLAAKLETLESVEAELRELGVSEELISKFSSLTAGVSETLAELPAELTLSFKDDYTVNAVGVYAVIAVVTDSDHYPSVDAGLLVIQPDVTATELKWNYEDENGIFSRELLKYIDLYASAYEDGKLNEAATDMIQHRFITVDENGVQFYEIAEELANGAYVELAYIPLAIGGEMTVSDLLARPVVIVPNNITVELVGDSGTANNDLLKEFNNEPQGFGVKVYNVEGTLIYSDHYQTAVNSLPDTAKLNIRYYGVQTNGKTYDSAQKPVHAGAYTILVTYVDYDEAGNITAFGGNMGLLVIEPTTAEIIVNDVIIKHEDKTATTYNLAEAMDITANSKAECGVDTTIITASIATSGDFSENGWDAISGNVNVDFPGWVRDILNEHAPDVMASGITAGVLVEKLNSRVDAYQTILESYGATEEIVAAFGEIITTITETLSKLPEDVQITFAETETLTAQGIGAYLVIGIVTDSDHYPTVDTGILVIHPDVDEVFLKWNYEDENGIFTQELMQSVDLYASAYDDAEFTIPYTDKEYTITYQFIGTDAYGNPVITGDASELANGIYTEIAYIEFEIAGEMVVSNLIARPIVIVPNVVDVTIMDKDEDGVVYRTFDNEPQDVDVTVSYDGTVVSPDASQVEITYTGIQTNGKEYNSANAPKHAGVYTVTAVYTGYENDELMAYGVDAAILVVEPAESAIAVTGKTVTYDGGEHTATVTVDAPNPYADYILISGGAYVSGDIDEIGVDAFHGNVNIDFPRWIDEILAEHTFAEGVDSTYLASFIRAYRDDLIAAIPAEELAELGITDAETINGYIEKINAAIDELLNVLAKLPTDVALTFEDDITYTEPGYYFYYGIVADSDLYPSTDTGLLVIEKMEMKFGAWHEVVTYDGKEHTVYVPNDEFNIPAAPTVDYITMVVNRENNSVNIITDEDLDYVWTTVERILNIDLPTEISIADLRELVARSGYTVEDFANVMVSVIDAVLSEMEAPAGKEYYGSTYHSLVRFREVILELPEDGVITFNGGLPVEVGAYEFYIVAYSQYYESQTASAVLFIEPIRVVVDTDIDQGKIYGEADPKLTASVKYIGTEGRENVNGKYSDWEIKFDASKYGYTIANADATIGKIRAHEYEIVTLPEDVLSYTVTREEGEDVGAYALYINAELTDSENYVLETVEDDVFKINPAQVVITLDDQTKTYGEDDPKLTYTVTGLVNEDTEKDALNIVVSREKGENVGEYIITATATNAGSYNYDIAIENATLTINKALVSVKANDATMVYGDAEPTYTATVSGMKNGEVLNVAFNRQPGNNVGTYAIEPSLADLNAAYVENYQILFATGTLTITKAKASVDVNSATKVYGDEDPTFTAVVSGMKFEDKLKLVFSREKGENVGKYTITAALAQDDVVAANYDILFATDTLTITKAIASVVVDNVTKVYGQDDPAFTYTVSGMKLEDTLDVTINRVGGKNVGTYSIYATAKDDNYFILFNVGYLTITKAPLTVTVNDATKVYGDDDPTFTADIEGLQYSDKLNLTFERAEGKDVGSYEIKASTNGALNAAYIENYEITYSTGTLTITKAPVTITIVSDEITYGEETPAVELIYSDERAKDEVAPAIIWNAPQYADAGEYTAKIPVKGYKNWTVTYVGGKLTVKPAEITVTMEEGLKLYGQDDPAHYHYTVSGLVNGDQAVELTFTRAEGEDTGYYAVSATSNDPNYVVGNDPVGQLFIAPASVNIVVEQQCITYGETPEFTAHLDVKAGKPSAEELAAVEKALIFKAGTIDGTTWTNWDGSVGTYDIVLAGDYSFMNGKNIFYSIEGNTLIVEPKAVSIVAADAECFEGQEPVLTYTVDGEADSGENFTLKVMNGETEVTDLTALAAGEYTIVPVLNSENYTVENATNGTLIVKALTEVTVKAVLSSDTIVQNQTAPTVDIQVLDKDGAAIEVEGLVDGTYAITDADGNPVADLTTAAATIGKYTVTPEYTEPEGYKVTVVTAELTVEDVGEYVCYNVQTDVYYTDLSDALEDVEDEDTIETIRMLKDYVETDNVYISSGTTLDLDCYTVTAMKRVTGYEGSYVIGDIYSNSKAYGKLIVNGKFRMYGDVYEDSDGYGILPLLTKEGYVFTGMCENSDPAVNSDRGLKINADEKTIWFQFVTSMDGAPRKEFIMDDGGADNGLSVRIYMKWTTEDEEIFDQYFTYNDNNVRIGTGNNKGYRFILSNYDELNIDESTVEIRAEIVTECGLVVYGQNWPN